MAMNKVVAQQRTIPRPQPGGLDPDSIVDAFALRMMYSVARDQYNATDLDAFHALAYAVRDRLMERWFATQDAYYRSDAKRAGGRHLSDLAQLGNVLAGRAADRDLDSEAVRPLNGAREPPLGGQRVVAHAAPPWPVTNRTAQE